ncbi:hypothetical protein [Dongia deserti]|uniref:hypothetical protein n=1 Tax=Dongia deserti TaxID=2268030 RepID=UPI0013C45F0A|nr:hypothetical protein [Dongia deserti]
MDRRLILVGVLGLICAPAVADEQITIRPGFRDRWIIEDDVGRNLGTIRRLNDRTLVIEDMNGRDIGTIRDDHEIDLGRCGDERAPLSCLFDGEDEDD